MITNFYDRFIDYVKNNASEDGFFKRFGHKLIFGLAGVTVFFYVFLYIGFSRFGFLFSGVKKTPSFLEVMISPFTSLAGIGILCLVLLAVLPAGYLYIMHRIKLDSGYDEDERYRTAGTDTLGSAHWMSKKDLEEDPDLEWKPREDTKGIILGYKDGKVVSQNPEGRLNKNIMVAGMAGSGKSTGFILPYVYQSVHAGESLVCVDTKGDVYSKTVNFAAKRGYEIRVFNCRDPEKSDGWNILDYISKMPKRKMNGEVEKLADAIFECIKGPADDKEQQFWRNGSLLLLEALMVYVITEKNTQIELERKGVKPHIDLEWNAFNGFGTIGRIYAMLVAYDSGSNPYEYLAEHFSNVEEEDPHNPSLEYWKAFDAGGKADVKQSIVQNLNIKLSRFKIPEIRKMLGETGIDLNLPATKKCIYYVNLSEQDPIGKFMSSLFFRQLCFSLTDFADAQPDLRCPIPVTLLLDEFGAIGTIPNFDRFISGSRSRQIHCVIAYQNISQLLESYEEGAETITANCEIWLSSGINDKTTAAMFSEAIGQTTVETTGFRTQKRTGQILNYSDDYAENTSISSRMMLEPAEIMRFPRGHMLTYIAHKDLLDLEQIKSWEMEEFKEKGEYNIKDYLRDRNEFKEKALAYNEGREYIPSARPDNLNAAGMVADGGWSGMGLMPDSQAHPDSSYSGNYPEFDDSLSEKDLPESPKPLVGPASAFLGTEKTEPENPAPAEPEESFGSISPDAESPEESFGAIGEDTDALETSFGAIGEDGESSFSAPPEAPPGQRCGLSDVKNNGLTLDDMLNF